VAISQENKLSSTGGFLHFTQSAFFSLELFPIMVYLAGEKTQ
jgi:hypothetical protein